MNDALSQDAIDQLLPKVQAGEPIEAPADQRKIKIYDFKRPDKFSKDQIRTVSIMHETFARQATIHLSSQLRTLANLHVASVDQLTYEEFIRSIPNPTTIAVINMDPLKGAALLEIDPATSFAIIERLFGGQGDGGNPVRDLTDIEHSVMEGIVVRMLGDLRESWKNVLDLRPRLTQIETNPNFFLIVPPAEMIVLVTLEARIGDARGMMNLVLPYLTIEPIINKLSAQYFYSSIRRGSSGSMVKASFELDLPAELYFEGTRLSLRNLGELSKGSLIEIPGIGQDQAFLRMGGRTLFRLKVRRGGWRRPGTYTVAGGISKENIPLLEPLELAEEKSKPSELETIEAGMREALRELGAKMSESLAGMKGSIGALRQKQDEMADQLAFGAQEPVPPEAKGGVEHVRPFDFLRRADPAHLLNFFRQEHPQLIALILSYLEPQKASAVLGNLPQELQPDVARRIACMGPTAPEVLREVERVLEKKLSVVSSEDYALAGGIEGLVEILNMADRSTERFVVDSLERKDAELAEEIKKRMFVFEDIVLLEKKDAEKVVKKVDADVLLRAMKAAPPEVIAYLWGCMPRADGEKLKVQLNDLGPVRLHEVERAQQKIVGLIREMHEAGEIIVERSGEVTKVVE